jgi:hypothetical protein
VQAGDRRVLGQRPDDGVFPAPRTNDKNAHGREPTR